MMKPKVKRNTLLAYGLLLPAFAVCTVFIAYPVLATLINSLKPGATMNLNSNKEIKLSLSVYKDVLTDPSTWKTLGRSFVYLFGSLIPSYLLGLATALLLNKSFAGRRAFRTLMILPWAIPGVVASIIFVWMGDSSYGVINYMLKSLGLIDEYRAWFFEENLVMFSVILPTIWKGYPFFTVTLLAALQSIPVELYEAAEVDGCKSIKKFRYITMPEIQEASVLALILNGLWSFKVFDIIYSTTKGGPGVATTTIAIEIYNQAFQYFDICRASVEGILALAICAIVVKLLYPYMNKETK